MSENGGVVDNVFGIDEHDFIDIYIYMCVSAIKCMHVYKCKTAHVCSLNSTFIERVTTWVISIIASIVLFVLMRENLICILAEITRLRPGWYWYVFYSNVVQFSEEKKNNYAVVIHKKWDFTLQHWPWEMDRVLLRWLPKSNGWANQRKDKHTNTHTITLIY